MEEACALAMHTGDFNNDIDAAVSDSEWDTMLTCSDGGSSSIYRTPRSSISSRLSSSSRSGSFDDVPGDGSGVGAPGGVSSVGVNMSAAAARAFGELPPSEAYDFWPMERLLRKPFGDVVGWNGRDQDGRALLHVR